MANWYVNRDDLKSALTIPASTTRDHAHLDGAVEAISRLLDDYLGFHAYPSSGVRYYTPTGGTRLRLDYPLLAVDTIQHSSDGGSTYGSTMTTADYYLQPDNATEESPPRPFWEVVIRPNATSSAAGFPKGITRGTKITGTWGYFNQTANSSATLATALAVGTTTIKINISTALHPGQTILMGSEQMFLTRTPTSATGSITSTVDVLRAQNGTVGATHSCATTIAVYTYPIIERAALYQAEQDYRGKDAPFGNVGGQPGGGQSISIGLHPFTRRMLDGFRKPVVA